MLTQFLSALSKPRSMYLCFGLVVVLTGLAIIPLKPAKGKVNETKVLNNVPPTPNFTSNSAAMFSPPTISLTGPTNNANFISGSTITLAATAVDSDGTVSKVEFFQGTVKLGEDTTTPYSYDWRNVAAGDYVFTARATDNAGEITASAAINISVVAQVKQYVNWAAISNGTDLGTGSVHKTSTGAWDCYANSLQTLVAGDGYFESAAASYNQSISLVGADGLTRSVVIGSGGWVGIYEANQLVAATSSNPPVPIISAHTAGDRYRIEITNSILRYIRYRSASREVMFTSAVALPAYPIYVSLGLSPQNAEWQKTVLAQLTRKVTWSSITNGTDLGNGSVKKTSTGAWDFSASAAQTLVRGDGYFESTASYWNHSINLGGSDSASRALVVGTGGWAAIYENGQEVANTYPLQNITPHATGDRYRLEITNGSLRYVRYRSGVRVVLYTSANPLPAYPLSFSLGSSYQNSEWQNTVIAQLSQNAWWSYITNGIDLGSGSVRKTSTGTWDFGAGPKQQLVGGSGYFESTASYWNHSISAGGADGAARALVVGTGGWAAIYENGAEVASTSPLGNIAAHAAGDRYRVELSCGKLRYVRYRASVRSIMFTSANVVPPYALGYGVGASFQNSEWQNTIFSDNVPDYNDASFVSQTVATTMVPGQTYSVSVMMRNTGASTWTPDGDYQLASENLPDNQRWGLNRVNLTTTVPPGSDATFNFTLTAPATGSHSFQWRMVQQGVERFGALTTNVNVQTVNGAPSVSLSTNGTSFTAPASINLSATAADSDGTISKVEFFQGSVKLGEHTTPPSPYTYTWTNVAAGNYLLTARATDNGGATTTSDVVSVRVNPPNQPPLAQHGGPYSGITGTAVPFNGGGSSDTDGYIASYQWTFGDTTIGTGATPTHTYAVAGSYQVSLTVTDNNGAQASATTTATIANRAPVANAGGPYTGITGTAVLFNGGSSADPDGNIASYQWNFGDGTNGTGATPTHIYLTSGTPTITLTVIDNNGASGSATTVATITASTNVRLDPLNQTGGEGENPLSRNFNWSIPLVGLPGRSGLDLGLSLSYNSLVWTRNGSSISFDDDGGFPSPGFRLGFPVIQSRYFNSQVGRYAFMLITPNGDRIDLRQVNTTNIYEAADSSYLTLTVNTDNTITVRTTDGTQLSYEWKVSDYECTKIKDRNGNFISINYVSGSGRLDTVVDTLSRTIKFNYDTGGYLISITQVWNQGTATEQNHNWATFSYNPALTIQTNFPGLTNIGPQNGATRKVLTSVKLNNNTSRFDFGYTSWGQVSKISHYAADGHLLNYRAYDLPLDNSNALSDCPRFTERRDWAESWNGDVDGTPSTVEEDVTLFAQPVNASLPDGSLQTVTMARVTFPDGTYHQIYFAGTIEGAAGSAPAWQRGLPLVTETFGHTDPNSPVIRQRSSASLWQDDLNGSYPVNPRVAETNIYDFNASGVTQNHKRTAVTYQHVSFSDGTSCNLTQEVLEYRADALTVLRRTQTDYNLATTYTDRRIIGLASEKRLYEVDPNAQTETLMSRLGFSYDEGSIQGTDAPVQHDNTNYNSSFVTGRANLTSVKRYDISPGSGAFVTTSMFYNPAGSVVKAIDPANHQTLFSYVDQFSANGTVLDAGRPSTFAYPTMATDPDGYTASSRYHYDFGEVTWKQTPQPNTIENLPGPQQTFSYDSVGRIQRVTNLFNGAYTRSVYPSTQPGSQNRIDTYATIVDGASEQNGNEGHSFKIFDGHGRVIANASSHPGSIGGFSGQLLIYDNMGRVIKQSNPTETSAGGAPSQWATAGDDAQAGWLYTQQTYDWKGRPLVTTNTDGTTKEASYAGCGCAGGEVVTLTDEGTIDGGVAKRRQQRIYADVLGRTVKTEVLNWQGGSLYSTTVNSYNARDQVTLVRQYQGPEGSTALQDTTITYDGYGRPRTKHVPEQDANVTTTYNYNPDDTTSSVVDARGASQTFSYNARHLVTGITYTAPSGIAPAPGVSFAYDAVGNRISMSDGMGSVNYQYSQLSLMTSEARTFSDPGNPAMNGVTKTLSYDYNPGGELKSISDPTGATINYTFDATGRLNAVTGSPFGSVTTYASGAQYRAWGAPKHLAYGNTKTVDATYNARLQAASFNIPGVMSKTYDYYTDGQVRFSSDLLDHKFDRFNSYDQSARITQAFSGAEARGEAETNARPYKQTFSYDAFSHLTARTSKVWQSSYPAISDSYSNNRRTGWGYDAAGNLLNGAEGTYSYDAAGNVSVAGTFDPVSSSTRGLDGDGRQLKTVEVTYHAETTGWVTTVRYYLHSTVLGGRVLTELASTGAKTRTFVYAGGSVLAWQQVSGTSEEVLWEHRDPSNASFRMTEMGGGVWGGTDEAEAAELDPTGANTGSHAPFVNDPPPEGGSLLVYPRFADPTHPGTSYTVDGIPVPVEYFMDRLDSTFQGSFGLAEYMFGASSIRFRNYEINYGEGPNQNFGSDGGAARDVAWRARDTTLIRNWIVNDWSFAFTLPPQDLVSLPTKQDTSMSNAYDALRQKLAGKISKDCQKNVIDKLAKAFGFNFGNFLSYLGSGADFYNGLTSQALVAGRVSPRQPADILYGTGATIASVFKSHPGTNALTSITSLTFLSFFKPDAISTSNRGVNVANETLLFHEALHGFTGKVDEDIQAAFGIGVNSRDTSNITKHIRDHCF